MGLTDSIRSVQRKCLDWTVRNFPGIGLDRRAEGFVDLFKEYVPSEAHVLDIGGGWGFYAEPLMRVRNCRVTVLDVVKPGFQKVPVVTYEGGRIPFPDRTFDVSLLITMLHHTREPEKILAEAKRVTRRFVIVVEDLYRRAAGRWWAIFRDTMYNFEFVGHPRSFRDRKGWLECFKRLGFQNEGEKEVRTSLLGLPILNGIFILGCGDERA